MAETDFHTNLTKSQTALYGIIGFIAIIILLATGLTLQPRTDSLSSGNTNISEGVREKLNLMKIDQPDLTNLTQSSSLCFDELLGQQSLRDFEVRKNVFVQQYHSGEILLWMVVAITLSGVVFAGFQIVASYKIAGSTMVEFGNDLTGEITLQKDKISLKSSVTGLLILVLSFAFFLVFVKSVYTIDIARIAPPSNPIGTAGADGGLGLPPAK